MTDTPSPEDHARAQIAGLLPIRDRLSQHSGVLRARVSQPASELRRDRLAAKALRSDRLVRLLDTRIRLAAEILASEAPQYGE